MRSKVAGSWITYNGRRIFVAHPSRFIKTMSYDPDLQEATVSFRNKTTYRYYGVKENEVRRIANARSVGKEFWKTLRRQKTYSKEKT
jgi:hypothetical protein